MEYLIILLYLVGCILSYGLSLNYLEDNVPGEIVNEDIFICVCCSLCSWFMILLLFVMTFVNGEKLELKLRFWK